LEKEAAMAQNERKWHPPKEPHEYDDIPGTVVFDAQRSRLGYNLNKFLYSLMKAENRKAFLADESTYLDQFNLMPAQKTAVMKRDWNTLLDLGGVSYALAKLAFTDQHSYQFMAAEMAGVSQEAYVNMMLSGGRSIEGWRSKKERGEA
jgi:protocatechuate 4,5-dioxygenase alpha chain